jgi:hypothetical protein
VSETSKRNWANPEIRKRMIEGSAKSYQEHLKDPDFAEKMSEIHRINGKKGAIIRDLKYKENPELKEQARIKRLITKASNVICNIIKEHGEFKPELYPIPRNGLPSINYLKQHNLYDQVVKLGREKALMNHKVVSVETLYNQDVYCLTAEYLGNFVVDVSDDENSNICSGVVELNCKDFFFTAAYYNNRAGCLYGPPPKPYIRKTTTRPPRNPAGLVLCCKHIYNSWAVLRNSGLTIN